MMLVLIGGTKWKRKIVILLLLLIVIFLLAKKFLTLMVEGATGFFLFGMVLLTLTTNMIVLGSGFGIKKYSIKLANLYLLGM